MIVRWRGADWQLDLTLNRFRKFREAWCSPFRNRFARKGWLVAALALLAGCDTELRKSDTELGLNPRQAAGRKIYDRYCDHCHEPYSSRGKKGPSMKSVFQKQYLSISGLPANDERIGEIIVYGRSKMPAFGRELSQEQVQDLLAYMHTL